MYPYNTGDLTISAMVLYNYLEANAKVPWEDLRYLFGEIMYGGHITDDWDRKLCRTYLEEYMHPDMVNLYCIFITIGVLKFLYIQLVLNLMKCFVMQNCY